MLKNYFKTAWRNLMKNKANSFINIIGLSTGMAVAILIGLWIWSELSFDKNFDNYNRIAQVMQTETFNGEMNTTKGNVMPLAAELRKNYGSDFKYVVLSTWSMNSLVASGDKKVNEQGNYMETDAPDMLSLDLVAGTRKSFSTASTVLLSQSTAKALFGNEDPLNKVVRFDNKNDLKVTGVLKDIPANSTLQFNYLVPFSYWESTNDFVKTARTKGFGWTNFAVYVKLKPGISYAQVEPKVRNLEKTETDTNGQQKIKE